MTASQLTVYLGLGLLYAVPLAAVLLALSALAGRRPTGWQALSLYLICFFLALTQHPFPDPATMDCSTGGTQPIPRPLSFLDRFARLTRQDQPLSAWFYDKVVLSTAFNFVLCAGIGAALARSLTGPRAWWRLLGIAVAVSGGAELAQLTAFFGWFPCPYRHFETDDLILNIGGMACGFALIRAACPGARPV